jgi:hypothetical protein
MPEEQEPVDPLCRSPASLVEAEVEAAGPAVRPWRGRGHRRPEDITPVIQAAIDTLAR